MIKGEAYEEAETLWVHYRDAVVSVLQTIRDDVVMDSETEGGNGCIHKVHSLFEQGLNSLMGVGVVHWRGLQ
jgi:hypothetical protein